MQYILRQKRKERGVFEKSKAMDHPRAPPPKQQCNTHTVHRYDTHTHTQKIQLAMDASCADMWKLLHGIVCMLRRLGATYVRYDACQHFLDLNGQAVAVIAYRSVMVHRNVLKTLNVNTMRKAFEREPGGKDTTILREAVALNQVIWRRWGADDYFCLSLEPKRQSGLINGSGWMVFPTMAASRIMAVVRGDTRLALPPSQSLVKVRGAICKRLMQDETVGSSV